MTSTIDPETGMSEAEMIEASAHDQVLQTAAKLIWGDRAKSYCHPLDDFGATGDYWTTWATSKGLLRPGKRFGPEDVGIMLVLMKISRESRVHGLDNLTDGAGYFGCVGKVYAERARRSALGRKLASLRERAANGWWLRQRRQDGGDAA